MVDYVYGDLFLKRSIDKQIKISADDGSFTATNSDISWNGLELKESLCSAEEIQFGLCEPSMIKFRIINAFLPLAGKWLTVTETLDGKTDVPFQYGHYKVFSDVPTADKEYRDIVAYDKMYDVISTDATDWYNSVLPDENSAVTLRQFRTSFIRYFGLESVLPAGGLVNDGMTVQRTVQPEQISGKDVIEAVCEINGCFGHIGRDGKFHYIYLEQGIQGLYPRDDLFPADDLYPKNPKSIRIGKVAYIKCEYEDYEVKTIDKLQIRQEKNDIGCIYGSGDNCYVIEDNFLVYGKGAEELREIARRIYEKISGIVYRPFSADCVGNPCLEVGDAIRMPTSKKIVESYILDRTLSGGQVLRDRYASKGAKERSKKVNSLQKSIIQLKGKTNILERNVEMTRMEIKDVEKGMQTEIKITAEGIKAEVEQNYESKTDAGNEYASIRSSISLESGRISSEIERATREEKNLSGQIISTEKELTSKILQTESNINLSVSSKIEETKTYAGAQAENAKNASNAATDEKLKGYSTTVQMNAAIDIKANQITTSVSANYETKTDSGTKYESLRSSISQTENRIEQKVSKGDISSEISQEAGKIHIAADRLAIESTNFRLTEDGEIESVKGTIGGFTITENSFGTDDDIISLHKSGDWAIRVGSLTEFGSPGKQYQFCVGHEGNVYCHGISVHEDLHIWGDIIHESSASTISLSDRKKKKDIEPLDKERAAEFIYSLNPVSYRFKKGSSGRAHHGLISQEVKKAMGGKDWGLYVEWIGADGGKSGLRYEELIPDLISTAQSLNERLRKIEKGENI